jgi:hypothetical protein
MTPRCTLTVRLGIVGAAVLLSLSAAAQEAPRSLSEARKNVNQGTTPGIVIWEPKQRPPAPAQAVASGAGGSASATTAAGPATQSKGFLSTLRELHPPSGQPLNRAKTLDSAGGIAVPTGASASAPRR